MISSVLLSSLIVELCDYVNLLSANYNMFQSRIYLYNLPPLQLQLDRMVAAVIKRQVDIAWCLRRNTFLVKLHGHLSVVRRVDHELQSSNSPGDIVKTY